MSFGFSVTDITTLVQIAWTATQNCRKACGEYDELTRQVESLHAVLRKLRKEKANRKSLLNRSEESTWDDLRPSLDGARKILESLDEIVSKYAPINRKDTTLGRFWTKAKFGNKELSTLNDLRQKARYYTGAISAILNAASLGSLGRVEDLLNNAGLEDLKPAMEEVASKLAKLQNKEGSVLTNYTNDDKAVWKELRRELVKEKIVPSEIISKNRDLITSFIRELGDQGILDDPKEDETDKRNATKRTKEAKGGLEETTRSRSARERSTLHASRPSSSISYGGKGNGDGRSNASTDEAELIFHSQARDIQSISPDKSNSGSSKSNILREPDTPRKPNEIFNEYAEPQLDDAPTEFSSALDTECDSEYARGLSERLSQFVEDPRPWNDICLVTRRSFWNGKHPHGETTLTSSNLLALELEGLEPNLPPIDPESDRMFWTIDDVEHGVYIYFIATPWGLWLTAGKLDLTLVNECLKFSYTFVNECLQDIKLPQSSLARIALKREGPQSQLQQAVERLERSQQNFGSSIRRVEGIREKFGLQSLDSCDVATTSDIETFCDRYLQWTYSKWDSIRTDSTNKQKQLDRYTWFDITNKQKQLDRYTWFDMYDDIGKLLTDVHFEMRTWLLDTVKDREVLARFALFLKGSSKVGASRLNLWLDEQLLVDAESSSSIDNHLTDKAPIEDDHQERRPDAETKLESIRRRLEIITQESNELSWRDSNPSVRRRKYGELSEAILINILCELDGLNIGSEMQLRRSRKELVEAAQSLMNTLEAISKYT